MREISLESDMLVDSSLFCRQGTLKKLSRGGFTANWNRREFVLIGCTLFYAKDKEVKRMMLEVLGS